MRVLHSDTTHLRHRDELRVLFVLLRDIGQPTEDQHPHDDDQHEQAELFVTERVFFTFPELMLTVATAAKGGQSYW